MYFIVLILSPDMIRRGLSINVLSRAEERGFISFDIWNIRDYTAERHGHVDDAPYDGGAGMLMQADPILYCHHSAATGLPEAPQVIYMTPQGRQFTQTDAKMFAAGETLLILCGHYEGVDERAPGLFGAESYSTGDYVPTGGGLLVMVMVDAISRMTPDVLLNQESGEIESFKGNLLEYPQYTCPRVYEGFCVPSVLLLGDHKEVAQWGREQALLRTRERRPDLFAKMGLNKADRKFLQVQAGRSTDES